VSSSNPAKASVPRASIRHRAGDIDRQVGARIRECRIMMGLTQQQMAELIGVTYQQAHKYEKGTNRVSAGRLYAFAQALEVEVTYFFEGVEAGKHQEAVCQLVRTIAGPEAVVEAEAEGT
jgi:transcriptional regulator with XRE-family HTH domain